MFSEKVRSLITQQVSDWNLAATNYAGLDEVVTKTFEFDGFTILLQFNPKRIISTSAKVDSKSINERPCFLCPQNLPPQQRGLEFKDEYLLLVNPFPIFRQHLTIPKHIHTNQRIKGNFEDLLDLSKALPDFTVIYNGPKCGASAPDHFHFQAGIKGLMPMEHDFSIKSNCYLVSDSENVKIYEWRNYLRGIITFEGTNKQKIIDLFYEFLFHFSALQPNEAEPLLNIITLFEHGRWIVHLFPRKTHRPHQFFDTGKGQILLSPASVDMSGVLITPRREDFEKITKNDIVDILQQVCLDDETIHQLVSRL
jgi:ATP adenylyltransferase/5',5'''-P-1,P-4-tetraphosphate phosphorylase II